MSIASRDARLSAIHIFMPWRGLLPTPEGAVDQDDRQNVSLLYSGIESLRTWSERSESTETWTERSESTETWTERTENTETWTLA